MLDGEVGCDHSLLRSSLRHAVLNGMVAPDGMARTPCPFPAFLRNREAAVGGWHPHPRWTRSTPVLTRSAPVVGSACDLEILRDVVGQCSLVRLN